MVNNESHQKNQIGDLESQLKDIEDDIGKQNAHYRHINVLHHLDRFFRTHQSAAKATIAKHTDEFIANVRCIHAIICE